MKKIINYNTDSFYTEEMKEYPECLPILFLTGYYLIEILLSSFVAGVLFFCIIGTFSWWTIFLPLIAYGFYIEKSLK
jgi:hypothetical protein